VDSDKVERALTNVLDNAAKFTPAGGDIVVRAWRDALEGGRIQVAIKNSGSNIPEQDLPHLFERFFRGDRARRTAGGSGLGLAIARQLAEMNGGELAVRNEDGAHVVFTFTFPGVPGPIVAAPSVAADAPPPARQAEPV